jgi:hypothetical protein
MFFIINKEKIYAYVVSIVTIVVLFFMSTVMKKDTSFEGIEETSTNVIVEKNMVEENLLNTSKNLIEENNKLEALVPNN